MTKSELSQLYYLRREIDHGRRRLAELRAAATGTAARITGLPYASGTTDKTAIVAAIVDCEAVLAAKLQQAVAEYNRLNRYIATVGDSLVRQILTFRFVEGMSWRGVARHVGGGNTADGVKKICYRFLDG